MKVMLFAVAVLLASGSAMADLAGPSTEVDCVMVKKDTKGNPDLSQVNSKYKSEARTLNVKSVSVSPVGQGYLVCTTAVDRNKEE